MASEDEFNLLDDIMGDEEDDPFSEFDNEFKPITHKSSISSKKRGDENKSPVKTTTRRSISPEKKKNTAAAIHQIQEKKSPTKKSPSRLPQTTSPVLKPVFSQTAQLPPKASSDPSRSKEIVALKNNEPGPLERKKRRESRVSATETLDEVDDWESEPLVANVGGRTSPPKRPKTGNDGFPEKKTMDHGSIETFDKSSNIYVDTTRLPKIADKKFSILATNATPGQHRPVRFFMMKTRDPIDLDLSREHNVWSTSRDAETELDDAFRSSQDVVLFFSLCETGSFDGYAIMRSRISNEVSKMWRNRWRGHNFRVQWVIKRKLHFHKTESIMNQITGMPACRARNGWEIDPESGTEICRMMEDETNTSPETSHRTHSRLSDVRENYHYQHYDSASMKPSFPEPSGVEKPSFSHQQQHHPSASASGDFRRTHPRHNDFNHSRRQFSDVGNRDRSDSSSRDFHYNQNNHSHHRSYPEHDRSNQSHGDLNSAHRAVETSAQSSHPLQISRIHQSNNNGKQFSNQSFQNSHPSRWNDSHFRFSQYNHSSSSLSSSSSSARPFVRSTYTNRSSLSRDSSGGPARHTPPPVDAPIPQNLNPQRVVVSAPNENWE